jgi:predicted ATPase with chaperone activity
MLQDGDCLSDFLLKFQWLYQKSIRHYIIHPEKLRKGCLSRTIADLRLDQNITNDDILEAFQYRPKLYQDKL